MGIFALGLLLSQVVVKVRGKVTLAEAVALPFGGVSASLPQGSTWQAVGGWQYERDNAFVLLGVLGQSGQTLMTARWRYALCDEAVEPEALLRKRADSAGARLTLLGQAPGTLGMEYGRIESPSSREAFLMGVAVLERGRRLELHIAYVEDAGYAEAVFRAMAEGAAVLPCPLQAAGAEQVEQFYRTRLRTLAGADSQSESGLLIKDAANRPWGYAVYRTFAYEKDGTEGHMRLTLRQFEAPASTTESDLWLSFAEDTFSWSARRQEARTGQPLANELRANAAGRIVVHRNGDHNTTLQRTPMMLPDPLTAAFVGGDATTQMPEMVIDVLTDSGFVAPVRIRQIAAAEAHVKSEQAARFVRLDYLHAEGTFEEIVFDAAGVLVGRFEQVPSRPAKLWEAATLEQLRQIFGERFEPRGRESVRVDAAVQPCRL